MSFPEQAVRSLVITTGMKNAGKGNAAGYFPHGSAFPLPSTPHQNMTDEKMSTEGNRKDMKSSSRKPPDCNPE